MSHDFFGDRRQALETAFFAKMNAELKQKLEESRAIADRKRALMEQAGVQNEQVAEHLARLGLTPGHVAAIGAVPLVMVAWANHHVDEKERRVILDAAAEVGLKPGSAARAVLEHWLREDPGEAVYAAWRESVGAVREALPGDVGQGAAERLYARAERVARCSGGFLTLGSISPAEQARLDDIKRTLKL